MKTYNPKVSQIIENIELNELDKLVYNRLKQLSIDIKAGLKKDKYTIMDSDIFKEHTEIQHITTSIKNEQLNKMQTHRHHRL